MKYVPLILMLASFLIICLGAYLKSQHNALGLPLIIGGILGELMFMVVNRLLTKNNKN